MATVLVTIVAITGFSLLPPLLMRDLIDRAIPGKDIGRVTMLGLAMVAVPLVDGVIGVVQRWASAKAGEGIIFDLRTALFGHLQRMSLAFFTATRPGELMSRLNSDVVGAQQAITGTFVSVMANTLSVIGTMIIMLGLEWRLTLVAVAILPLFIVPSRRVGRVLRTVTRDQMNANARMNSTLNETLNVSGALLVKLFGRTRDEDARYGGQAAEVRDLGVRRALIGRWFFMALGVVSALGTALVFWLGAVLVIDNSLTIGTIVALSAYLANLYGPLTALSNARVELATSLVSFERVFEVLDLPHDIEEQEDAVSLEANSGRVTFEAVSFDYGSATPGGLESVRRFSWFTPVEVAAAETGTAGAGGREKAIAGLDFEVSPGELVALVGPSGAGKTTVTYLIPRLYDVTEGRLLIDGVDVRDATLESLGRSIGVVTQETYLFHDTIAANLRYARPDATAGQIEEACRTANIHDFVASLPAGYDTMVGERGYRLSGGEKQRLAIARVILKDPRILILDEATAHLDARSEALIQEALERVMAARTSFVIAHRLSTVLAADRILVLDEGRLVEQGTHGELLAQGGLYARLYETQFQSGAGPEMPARR
ncbi:MAG: ABC transporter ATP-binding protein/permease [Actinobacteria bacterium]|nr:ABC transporter ATP-binding protein/permease [Actinomycetota bacterium]MBU1493087.1 ABC transporter ATP-binding protein/permease [Actinomycetota bacterium]